MRDGTVLLGLHFLRDEIQRGDITTVFIVMAHEFAHILQYKQGITAEGPWQMEPHADFMAAWALVQCPEFWRQMDRTPGSSLPQLLVAVKTLFAKGDTLFNDPSHHGQPELRAAMVHAGFEAGMTRDWLVGGERIMTSAVPQLNLSDAFERGAEVASLDLKPFCEPENRFAICSAGGKRN
jgi:hypothetical protein